MCGSKSMNSLIRPIAFLLHACAHGLLKYCGVDLIEVWFTVASLTRYLTRGCDSNGDAANFVETEQIVLGDIGKSSFVQVTMEFLFMKFLDIYCMHNVRQ